MNNSGALRSKTRSQEHIYQLAALLFAVILVVTIDLLTNSLDIHKFSWDFKYYIDMAEHGIFDNPNLRAPFAYRYATPWLSSTIARVCGLSTENGFRAVAYVGAISQLFLIYVFARYLGARFRESIILVLVIAVSLFHVKFLLFDVYRPDHLAYPFMLLAMLFLLENKLFLCVLVSLVGTLFREFLIIPGMCVSILLAVYCQKGAYQKYVYITAITLLFAGEIILPRILIPVSSSTQYLDPIHNSRVFLYHLVAPILSVKRDFNMIFNVMSYFLPTLCLITMSRWQLLKDETRKYRLILYTYSSLVLLLTLYGGTDIYRFVTYFFIPQIIFLIIILIKSKPHWIEIATMLLIMTSYNRIFLSIPVNSRTAYLNWYGGHSNRVNLASLERFVELVACIGITVFVRYMLARTYAAHTKGAVIPEADVGANAELEKIV